MDGHLYFHSPCFDGIVSAVLLNDFLEAKKGWATTHLHAVNYDLKTKWLQTPLEPLAAIVDFLYHPGAQYWADHHATAFLTDAVQTEYEGRRGPTHVYEPTAPSCAGLLWRHLWEAFGHRNRQFEELSIWADKTDSANYESVDEAIFGEAPALRISKALGDGSDESFCVSLVQQLRRMPLPEAAELPEVRLRFERTLAATRAGLTRLRQAVHLDESGIAVFDVDSGGVTINRYAPFHFFPEAKYSLGIVRWANGAKITAMRNPWMEFPSVPLGRIFEQERGGGHQRVGSVLLDSERAQEATAICERLLVSIKGSPGASGGGNVR